MRSTCTVHSDGNDFPAFSFSKCEKYENCGNNFCYFKQRDCYGLCCWVSNENNKKIYKKFGSWIYPAFKVIGGTNCMYVYCESYKDKKPVKNKKGVEERKNV